MTEKHSFGVEPITCHSFSNDRKGLALSKNDNDVIVYKKEGTKWTETGLITEHCQRVTSIDWASKSNRLVTCGADRNAYVWTLEGGAWKPHLVILRINRAATFVRWSPEENKSAVGSGARLVSICYFEEENNWWVSKHIKKPIESTITCVDWHHNNILLATGSTDFKARVFSAYVKEIESKPSATNWGTKIPFGTMMAEYSSGGGGWVHSVSFSASGDKLAWVGHDASIAVVDAANGQSLTVVKGKYLPFCDIVWVTENSMVAVGYDCCPKLYTQKSDGSVEYVHDLDIPNEGDAGKMSYFKNLDKRGGAGSETMTALKFQHQNTITQVSIYAGSKSGCDKVATSGVDGQIIIWDLKVLMPSHRHDIEDKIEVLQPDLFTALEEIVQLKDEKKIIEQNQRSIEINLTFSYTITERRQKKISLPHGRHVTNCLNCFVTCHDNCAIPRNEDKHCCVAMEPSGYCRECVEKCHWSSHANTPHTYVYVEEIITRSYLETANIYRRIPGEEMTVTKVLDRMGDHKKDLEQRFQKKMDAIRAYISLLRRHSSRQEMTLHVQINLLIQSEEKKLQTGYEKRVEVLRELRAM